MAMGRRKSQRQSEFWIPTVELPASPGHPFYEQLNQVLAAAGFDRFCEERCRPFYAAKLGRPSVPPEVYFRKLMVGYFEKLPSERQIAWRCADSLSLRAFLGLAAGENSPDDSSLNRTRLRIDLETHQLVFDWVLGRLAEHELLKGRTLGVDGSTLEANAAMRSIVRRETGQSYREFLTDLAKASGIETPSAADLAKFDRQRKDKKCGNDDWFNPHDPDAKVAKLKDGTTHLAYKNKHAVDLETGAIVAAEIHLADQGDTTTMWGTLEQAANSLQEVREDETVQADTSSLHVKEVVADKGYHSAQTLVNLEEVELRGYISEPDRGPQRWAVPGRRGMTPAELEQEREFRQQTRQAVHRNRRRRRGRRSRSLHRKRGELVERSFEHVLDDGGLRRVYLRGRANIAKRYLIHTAAFNLGLIMRKLTGFGTPRGWADARRAAARRCGALWEAVCASWHALVHARRSVLPQIRHRSSDNGYLTRIDRERDFREVFAPCGVLMSVRRLRRRHQDETEKRHGSEPISIDLREE